MAKLVEYQTEKGIAIITLNDPPANTYTYEMMQELDAAILQARFDPSWRRSRGTIHLQHDMVVCADLYARPILVINEQDMTFSAAKLFFAYGLGNNLYFPFRVGASTILHPGRPLPEKMFERRYIDERE